MGIYFNDGSRQMARWGKVPFARALTSWPSCKKYETITYNTTSHWEAAPSGGGPCPFEGQSYVQGCRILDTYGIKDTAKPTIGRSQTPTRTHVPTDWPHADCRHHFGPNARTTPSAETRKAWKTHPGHDPTPDDVSFLFHATSRMRHQGPNPVNSRTTHLMRCLNYISDPALKFVHEQRTHSRLVSKVPLAPPSRETLPHLPPGKCHEYCLMRLP
jgi:hypothetical protein